VTRDDGQDPFSREYAVCVSRAGTEVGPVTELLRLSARALGCGEGDTASLAAELAGRVPETSTPRQQQPAMALPASFDWRSYQGYDWLTPIKSQGGCGSCWAFSAVAVAEAAHNIGTGNAFLDLDLSEQYLVSDCHGHYGLQTCCGGWKDVALRAIRDSGVPDEGCMVYVDGYGCSCDTATDICDPSCTFNSGDQCSDRTCDQRCADWAGRLVHLSSVGWVSGSDSSMKQALVDHGPLVASLGIGADQGGYWDGDIYRCLYDSSTNHAIAIVGYDDAGGYWIIRNSWGAGWGDGGYYKLGYGECSLERAYWAEVHAPGITPTPTPTFETSARSADAPFAPSAPRLDGHLSEWSGVPATILAQGTANWWDYRGGPTPTWQDASVVLQATWDGNTVYFGLHANDDALLRDSGEDYWRDDTIIIWIDGDADGEQRSPSYDHNYAFATDGFVRDWNQPTDLQVARQLVAGGWDLEVAVPASHFPPGTLLPGQRIRFSFAYADDDDGGNWDGWLVWEGHGDNNASAVHYGYLVLQAPLTTATPTATATPSVTPTATSSPSVAATATPTHTATATPSETPTITPTFTPTDTLTPTAAHTPTATPSPTSSPTSTPQTLYLPLLLRV